MTLKALSSRYKVEYERQIVVTEVTRMTGGLVCVAGLDIHSGTMVRPLQPDGSNWEEPKWVTRGFMVVGNILSLVPAPEGTSAYPHANEDYRVKTVSILGTASTDELYTASQETADASVDSLFNRSVEDEKYVVADTKCRSLGCIMVSRSKLKASEFYGKVQVSYRDHIGTWHNFPVTDLITKSFADPTAGAAALNAKITSGNYFKPIALRLGLARAWDGGDKGYNPKRCYLQLNGLIIP